MEEQVHKSGKARFGSRRGIAIIRRVKFLWHSTVTRRLRSTRKEESSCLIPQNEGRLAPAWVSVRGGMRVLPFTFGPKKSEKSQWCKGKTHVFLKRQQAGTSTCRPTDPGGELVERTCDFVIARKRLRGSIEKMEVVEDFESRLHMAVTFRGQVTAVVKCQAGAHDNGAQFELGLELALSQCRFPRLPQVEIVWSEVWRARKPREELDVALLQKRLGARDGAFSSCRHQLDVSVPRHAMQCGKYTLSSIRM